MSNLFNLRTPQQQPQQQHHQQQHGQQRQSVQHLLFPVCCLLAFCFCFRLANCIMKMSINFSTICHQSICYADVLPPSSHTHTQAQTHTAACHTQCQLQIEFICWRQILTWQTHFYFILFAFLFHSLLMLYFFHLSYIYPSFFQFLDGSIFALACRSSSAP